MTLKPLTETSMGSLRAFLEDAGTHRGRSIVITTDDARDIATRLNEDDAKWTTTQLQEHTTKMLADVLNVDASMQERVDAARLFCARFDLKWPPFPDAEDEEAECPSEDEDGHCHGCGRRFVECLGEQLGPEKTP